MVKIFNNNQDPKSNGRIRNNPFELFAENIVETVRDSLLVLSSDLKVIFANPSFYRTFKTRQEETEGVQLFDLGNRQWNIPELIRLLDDILTHNTVFKDFQVEHDFRNIGKKIMHINARRLDRRINSHQYILLSITDVTDRIQMERKLNKYKVHLEELVEYREQNLKDINIRLAAEKEHLNVTLRSIGDAVIATDLSGNITLINHSAETLTGWSQYQALGKPLSEIVTIVDPMDNESIVDITKTIIETKGLLNIGDNLILVAKDGLKKMIADSASPIRNAKGEITGTVIVFRDITEEKRLEETLRQSQKMESIGTLAGGIAHDFNNILFAIMGYTDLAMLELKDNNRIFPYLEGISKASHRAKDLVQQILAFSRQGKQEFKPTAISSVVKEAVKLIRASLPSTIDIELKISTKAEIYADATQIYQIIYNLCTNAAQAIQDDKGLIKISLIDIEAELSPAYAQLNHGKYVKLSVTDSGHGISTEIKDKIFDPYFSTKQLNKGTGLGLSVVHGIIANHNGAISVLSTPGEGTTFDVYFPATETKDDRIISFKSFQPLETGHEKILLVDDENQIIQMERQMLEKLGYNVTAATNSNTAFEIFAASPYRFDLVITDMSMPIMNGYELCKKIRRIRPEIPIILCSGYSNYLSDEKIQKIGINAFVSKPLTMIDLSNITRKILDQKIHERRQNDRFKIKEKAIAFTKSCPEKECNIVDISWGGVAICCDSTPESQKQIDELAINIVNRGIILDKVPCKVVSNITLFDDLYPDAQKRQGFQFRKLAYNQLNMLDHLIHSYTDKVR